MNFNFYILVLLYFYLQKSNGQASYNKIIGSLYDAKEEVKPTDSSMPIINQDSGISKEKNKTAENNFILSTQNDSASNHTSYMIKNKGGISTDAVFRGFYVVLGIGSLFLIYIGIKTFRLRRHRAANRYRVIATKNEDQESFFPLAADEGEDEEIFSAGSHTGSYS